MDVIRFDTESYPVEQRAMAWSDALRGASLTTSLSPAADAPRGSLIGMATRQGSRFLRLSSNPQVLSWQDPSRGGDLWLASLLEGTGRLSRGEVVRARDLFVGTMAAGGDVSIAESFRFLFVRLPSEILDQRLRRMAFDGGRIPTARGMGQVLTGFLDTIAQAMEALNPAQMYPLELSLSEILIATLAKSETMAMSGAVDRRKSRVCQKPRVFPSVPCRSCFKRNNSTSANMYAVGGWSGRRRILSIRRKARRWWRISPFAGVSPILRTFRGPFANNTA
jgi:hypothetical protein